MSEITSTVEEAGPAARTLKISISPKRVRARFDAAFLKLQARVQLKGFRKGKAPRNLLEQAYGEDVTRDVVGDLIEEGCLESIREHSLDVVAAPRLLNQQRAEGGGLEFEVGVDIRPAVRLGQYKELAAERAVVKVEDRHVDATLEALRQRMAVLRVEEDRVLVEPGDTVVMDMHGFEGDQPVPGTSGEGAVLEVGAGRFPEDFEKQLVGVTRAVRTPITVAFGEDYADEGLRGKTIRFEVTVREIKTKILPPVDDSLAAEAGIDGVETLEALRERIREDLRQRARRDAERRCNDMLLARLVETHEFDLPEAFLEETVHGYIHELGIPHGSEEEKSPELRATLEARARRSLKAGFLLDAIAAKENIEVSKEELEGRVRAQIASAGKRAEEVGRHYSRPGAIAELRVSLLREKAAKCIFDSASVQEREVEESQVADRG